MLERASALAEGFGRIGVRNFAYSIDFSIGFSPKRDQASCLIKA